MGVWAIILDNSRGSFRGWRGNFLYDLFLVEATNRRLESTAKVHYFQRGAQGNLQVCSLEDVKVNLDPLRHNPVNPNQDYV